MTTNMNLDAILARLDSLEARIVALEGKPKTAVRVAPVAATTVTLPAENGWKKATFEWRCFNAINRPGANVTREEIVEAIEAAEKAGNPVSARPAKVAAYDFAKAVEKLAAKANETVVEAPAPTDEPVMELIQGGAAEEPATEAEKAPGKKAKANA